MKPTQTRRMHRRWPVQLEHGPIRLRPLRRRDQGVWNEIRRVNREWLGPWEATLPPGAEPGPPTWASLVSTLNRQARQGRILPWAIDYNAHPAAADSDPVLVGQLTVSAITYGSAGTAQIGYWIDKRWAGRGIVPTTVAMAVDYCFDEIRLHRIEVAIRPENTKSLRVVAKLGFRPEGVRPRYLHIDHDWRDHAIFALNKEEVPGGLLNRYLRRSTEETRPG